MPLDAPTPPVEQLAVALADRYHLERELGAGGMATVYLAHDLRHDREVAIKVLRSDVAQSLGAERFLREIRLAARLNHPNILPLFDSGEAAGALYYVMPKVDGESLRDRLERSRQLPVDEAVRIAVEVAGALDHAHRHGVVHRDIKPENIMLQEGHALVADFGVGKALSAVEGQAFTQTGMSVGTPAYMSPEQAAGDDVDARTDLYSLGCVCYEMLVGEQPFTGTNVQAVIAKRFVQAPADVGALRDGVPRPVARAIQKVLSRTRHDRYESGAFFAAALGEADTALSKAAPPDKSLAVLPFENMSADSDNEFFGDGIAEEIINALAQIPGLRVAARTSAFSFKGRHEDLRVIGEKLNVATVLEGSVRKSGNRLRITAQLIDVADGYHRWSERYDRELVDVFAVQDEIASAIAAKLQVTLVKPAAEPAAPATTAQVEAYELCARGRAFALRLGRSILPALECFQQAIALAPEYAPAYAGLGETWRIYAQYNFGAVADVIPRARAALQRALELDPDNANAMGTLATIALMYDGDHANAHRLWERALSVNTILSDVRGMYAVWGLILTERDDARGLAELQRMVNDDPLSSLCAGVHAVGLGLTGHDREAIAETERAVALDPTSYAAHYLRVWAYVWVGDFEGADRVVTEAINQFGRLPPLLMVLPAIYLSRGDRVRAEAVYAELQARAVTSDVPSFTLAQAAMYLGRTEEAMAHAFDSADRKDYIGPVWIRGPFSDGFRDHPRYAELRRRMGY
jgi:serine/threonine-protein kinase